MTNAQNNPSNAYVRLAACCQPVDASFLGRSEVLKARWSFSSSTSLTAAYVGNQASFDLDGAQLQSFAATLAPSGTPLALNPTTHLPSNVTEIENEPLFETELRTTLRNDTLIARWYTVSLNRFTGNGVVSPAQPFTGVVNLTGVAPLAGGGSTPTFNGTPESITIPDVFSRTVEEDRVRGGSVAWLHPSGANEYEVALDRIVSLTNAYSEGASGGVGVFSASVPAGSAQTITSLMGRASVRATDADALTLALYGTSYRNHFSTGPVGTGFAFGDATHTEVDPRFGFTHRSRSGDAVVRFAMGGAVTPPAFNVLSGVNQTPASAYRPGSTSLTVTQNAGTLRPETSFGYDLGADVRLDAATVASFDAYLTNVHDQLVTTVTPMGTFTPPGATSPIPVYASAAANAGNARFAGLEASIRRDPARGWGFVAQGALTRAFAYAVSPSLYATATSPFGTNLAVLPGVNYTSTGTGFNGISNKAIPYGQAYAQAQYRTAGGALALLGMTYYGNNNAYGVPAFTVANASLRAPLGPPRDRVALVLSIDNVFNALGESTIATDGAIPVPLVNGKIGLVNALPFGPRTVRIGLHVGARVIGALLAAALTVIADPRPRHKRGAAHPCTLRRDAPARCTERPGRSAPDNRATFDVPPGSYTVDVTKSGFRAGARRRTGRPPTRRYACRCTRCPAAALRTIGAVAAAQRGAFNDAPTPRRRAPARRVRTKASPAAPTVIAQTPSVAVDRAARGLGPTADDPPVALVRGGTPLETQVLLEGVPVAPATTRTLALSAIPAFVVGEIEVQPGPSAPLPAIDGALNGTLNVRLPEPTSGVARAARDRRGRTRRQLRGYHRRRRSGERPPRRRLRCDVERRARTRLRRTTSIAARAACSKRARRSRPPRRSPRRRTTRPSGTLRQRRVRVQRRRAARQRRRAISASRDGGTQVRGGPVPPRATRTSCAPTTRSTARRSRSTTSRGRAQRRARRDGDVRRWQRARRRSTSPPARTCACKRRSSARSGRSAPRVQGQLTLYDVHADGAATASRVFGGRHRGARGRRVPAERRDVHGARFGRVRVHAAVAGRAGRAARRIARSDVRGTERTSASTGA